MKTNLNKPFSLFIACLLMFSILGACGQHTKDIKVKDDAKKQEQVKKQEETQPKLGSRSNPVPLNKTAVVDDELYDDNGKAYPIKFELTVLNVVRGDAAYRKLKSMNEFNEVAPTGYEWVLAKAKVKFTQSNTKDLSFNIDGIMNFEMVSESGDIYSGDIVASPEPDFSFEMYVGNEKEGYIADLVKKGEKADLRYETMDGGEVFFSLQ